MGPRSWEPIADNSLPWTYERSCYLGFLAHPWIQKPEHPGDSAPLVNYSPLRYPGGKRKLAPYIKQLIKDNRLFGGEYAEPYAGGAAIALELLSLEFVSRVHINDLSRPIYAFWGSVLDQTDRLCKLVRDTPLSLQAWDVQKSVFAGSDDFDDLSLGFATFYLNRTNRSGVLNGGIIGGRTQTGQWKIDARFNRQELVRRIESIASMRHRIKLTRKDALVFLGDGIREWPDSTLIYLDPPYYVKGQNLYYEFYKKNDHETVAKFVSTKLVRQRWIVSYDNDPAIRKLYQGYQRRGYKLGYSIRSAKTGEEIMFFSDRLQVPPLVGPVKPIRGSAMTRKTDELYTDKEAESRFEAALRGASLLAPEVERKAAKKRGSEFIQRSSPA
jgi:DNA adenine methylase